MQLVFATNNENKLKELREIISDKIELLSLKDIGCTEDIPETQDTIKGNAMQKAEYVFDNYKVNCFADDTGLCVNSLNGEPGVYSARYAGKNKNAHDNMNLLLEKLNDKNDRSAYFITEIALCLDGKTKTFNGKVQGSILKSKSGNGGFGYDPIFSPDGYNVSFAEMSSAEKNKISHRGLATKKLIEYLSQVI